MDNTGIMEHAEECSGDNPEEPHTELIGTQLGLFAQIEDFATFRLVAGKPKPNPAVVLPLLPHEILTPK